MESKTAHYHLPGLFEFYEFYSEFLPLFSEHREYFYEWCDIGSIYGAPCDCLWGGGRVGFGENSAEDVLSLTNRYGISARLTFSNSLITTEHLSDKKCNELCRLFDIDKSKSEPHSHGQNETVNNGIIIYSDILLDYIKEHYPSYYFVSTTTKVITDFDELINELNRFDYSFVVPDFRFNNRFELLDLINDRLKDKVEFLCNECCSVSCTDRKACYENVSHKSLGHDASDHICTSENARDGYVFSKAMKSPAFISVDDIKNTYMKKGFSNFKIEGRSLGSALLLEFILHYMTKPEYQLNVREALYLNHSLDLF